MSEVVGLGGTFGSASTPIHISTQNTYTYKWLIRVPPGDKLKLSWTMRASQTADMKVTGVVEPEQMHIM